MVIGTWMHIHPYVSYQIHTHFSLVRMKLTQFQSMSCPMPSRPSKKPISRKDRFRWITAPYTMVYNAFPSLLLPYVIRENCAALILIESCPLFLISFIHTNLSTLLTKSCDRHFHKDICVFYLPATFRKILQGIFSSFEFGSKLDPQNTGLLGIVVCGHIDRIAFNLVNLWESTLNFLREHWRWRKRVGSIN